MSDKAAAVVKVVSSTIVRVEAEVDEETGEVWLVAYDRDGREIGGQLAIASLNDYHNKETK